MTKSTPKRILNAEEAADYIGLSRSQFYAVRDGTKGFPRPFKYNGAGQARYDVRDLDEWLDRQKAEQLSVNEPDEKIRAAVDRTMRRTA